MEVTANQRLSDHPSGPARKTHRAAQFFLKKLKISAEKFFGFLFVGVGVCADAKIEEFKCRGVRAHARIPRLRIWRAYQRAHQKSARVSLV